MTTREDFTVFLNGLSARLEPEQVLILTCNGRATASYDDSGMRRHIMDLAEKSARRFPKDQWILTEGGAEIFRYDPKSDEGMLS